MTAALQFDEASHTYKVGGAVVPSVTQVLDLISEYKGVPRDVLERAAQLGRAVHRAVELKIEGRLDEASMHPDVAERFYHFWTWWRTGDFEPEAVEARVYSAKYGYAGTIDLVGKYRKKPAVIDTKTTFKLMVTAGPQTIAYEKAWREEKGIDPRVKFDRYALMLHKDKVKLEPLRSPTDWSVFLACLTVQKHIKRTPA